MAQLSGIVKHLLIVNGIFFLATMLFGEPMFDLFALHYFDNPKFQPWQVITHMFMHSNQSYFHILFNMLGVWMFGTPLERMWGSRKFIFFYLSAGLGAAALQLGIYAFQVTQIHTQLSGFGLTPSEIDAFFTTGSLRYGIFESIGEDTLRAGMEAFNFTMVGASGALYGVLVAFAIFFPNTQLMLLLPPIPIKAKYLVPLLIVFDLFFGFSSYSVGPIAHFAHVGGAIAGLLMMWYWNRNQFKKNRWDL